MRKEKLGKGRKRKEEMRKKDDRKSGPHVSVMYRSLFAIYHFLYQVTKHWKAFARGTSVFIA
jgi:aromatic ring-cleaving dioxygenase